MINTKTQALTEEEKAKITVVIPTMDEAETIGQIIEQVSSYAGQVLLVDGHSKDNTVEIAKNYDVKVIYDNKKGKGDALRIAIQNVETEITVFIDADGSHDANDIPRLVRPLFDGECDHVTGSRLIGGSSELHGGFDEFFRLAGSSFITACINWRFKVSLSDSQNGFRSAKTEVLKQLDLRENLTTIEQEMIMKTIKKGFIMGEVPTHEYKRIAGESHINVLKVAHRYVWSAFVNLFF